MLKLKPLIVVTGSIHVEGGEKNTIRSTAESHGRARQTLIHTRQISQARRDGNTIATSTSRKFKGLRIARTPFGSLVDPARSDELHAFLSAATQDVSEFNKAHKSSDCVLTNSMVWERLKGNRLAAVEGWLSRHADDTAIKKVLDQLVA